MSVSYQNLAENMPAIEKLAEGMLQASFFGLKNKGAALVVATELFVTGESPMEYHRRNGFVGATPYTPYDATIAAFQEAGGKLKLLSKTPDLASIELTYAGETYTFSLSWEELQKEPLVYEGKTSEILAKLKAGKAPEIKAKYATPRSRAIMLYARVVDDSIRSIASCVNFGRYVKEVVEDFQEGEIVAEAVKKTQAAIAQAAPPTQQVASQTAQQSVQQQVIPRQAAPQQTTETIATLPAGEQTLSAHQLMTPSLRQQILDQIGILKQTGFLDAGKQVSAKLSVSGIPDGLYGLTIGQGEELLVALKSNAITAWVNATLTPHPLGAAQLDTVDPAVGEPKK
jgi:hypothetical protein